MAMRIPFAGNLDNAVTVLQLRLGKRVAQLSSALCASLWVAMQTSYWELSVCPRISRKWLVGEIKTAVGVGVVTVQPADLLRLEQ
jgi:hypothetical protein